MPIRIPPTQRATIPTAATGRTVEKLAGFVGNRSTSRNRPTNVRRRPRPIFAGFERAGRRRDRVGAGGESDTTGQSTAGR